VALGPVPSSTSAMADTTLASSRSGPRVSTVKGRPGSELLEGGPRLLGQRGDAPSVAGSLGVGGLVGAGETLRARGARSAPAAVGPRLESVPGESGSHRRYSDLGCRTHRRRRPRRPLRC